MSTARSLPGWSALSVVVALALTACGGEGGSTEEQSAQAFTLYTCLSDDSIQPLIQAFEESHRGSQVYLFCAPTGEINARVAADTRSVGCAPTSSGRAIR
jgi:iron(III) transport system substrate-binding protein